MRCSAWWVTTCRRARCPARSALPWVSEHLAERRGAEAGRRGELAVGDVALLDLHHRGAGGAGRALTAVVDDLQRPALAVELAELVARLRARAARHAGHATRHAAERIGRL